MNLAGFSALGNAWLFSLLMPLVLFYFLKLRRGRLEVPSLVLWRQVLRDNRVNSPFQRFKRNVLLLLQLLLLISLILAAMQPYWRGKARRADRLPVLIDCSASMAALDKPGGSSRLEAAKERVDRIIDGLLPDQELCLISFGRSARRLTGFTSSKRVLREALDDVRVKDVPSDIEDALRMTQALARSAPFDEVLVFSDGNFPEQAEFELSFGLDYQRLPAAGPNLGITSLNARRWGGEEWDVFVCVEGSSDAKTGGTVELVQNGVVVGRESAHLGEAMAERMVFRLNAQRASSVAVTLTPDEFDSLACDNVAFLDLPATRDLWVYAPASATTYRHALGGIRGIRVFPEEGAGGSETSYDLVITDESADLAMQAQTYFCVGFVPGDLSELVSIAAEGAEVVDWLRGEPLLQHVEFSDMVILDQPRTAADVSEGDFENLGYQVLAHGSRGPLLLEKVRGDGLFFHLLFHTDRSTMPYRVGFPVMVANLVQIAMDRAGLSQAQANRTGVLPPMSVRPGVTCGIEGPRGDKKEARADGAGVLSGVPAAFVGQYVVSGDRGTQARVGVSLLDAGETTLDSVEEILFNEGLSVAVSEAAARTDRALWRALALLAFGVLLGEWWYFQRRPGGYAT